ncbi:MAG: hypothetical protein IH571_07410, partial [Acholeplasmataceae bacterium]|nr:hypothetical protein [Acholeplasmataceae bacterium]
MKIIELDKKEYKGFEIDCRYQTKAFFDVSIKKKKAILIKVKKKKLFKKKEKSFSATLFDEYIEAPRAFAVF